MLVRAATRRVPRDVLRRQLRPIAPSESIHLPWLYPSFSTPFRFVSSIARPAPKKLEKTQSINGRAFNTSTAAVPEPEYDDVAMYGNDEAIGSFTSKQDPSLVILDTPDPPSVVYANGASTQLTENEILSTFQACITSGMLARAQLMLLQLHQLLDKDAPELVSSHNCFLDALLNKVDTDSSHLKLFFMWYEERMKGKYNIKADVETYALLLKGSLRLPNEDIGKQYLKHYMGEAKRAEVSTDGLLSNGILTRDEATYVAKVSVLCRTLVCYTNSASTTGIVMRY